MSIVMYTYIVCMAVCAYVYMYVSFLCGFFKVQVFAIGISATAIKIERAQDAIRIFLPAEKHRFQKNYDSLIRPVDSFDAYLHRNATGDVRTHIHPHNIQLRKRYFECLQTLVFLIHLMKNIVKVKAMVKDILS